MNIFIVHILLVLLWESNAFSPKTYLNRYLTKENWGKIKEMLNHPQTTPVMKEEIRKQIYCHYYKWAQCKAYEFKRYHRHKCRSITLPELDIYSQRGLYQSIQSYNGRSRFLPYANLFVMGELYRGMTELQPMTHVPKSIRRRKPGLLIKRLQKKTQFVGENEWIFDKLPSISSIALSTYPTAYYLKKEEEQEGYRDIWEKVKELEPITQKIFQMKYGFLLEGGEGEKTEKSNRKIGEKLGYSEEFVRLRVQQIRAHFLPILLGNDNKKETSLQN